MARLAAGVKKRADGTLEKRFTIEGKRYSVYGKTSKEIAEKEQRKRNDIEAGLYKNRDSLTLDLYYSEWINRKRKAAKPNTIRLYSGLYLMHISPLIGKMKVKKISKREVQNVHEKAASCKSIRTANQILAVIKIILNSAVSDEIILKSPAANVSPMKEDMKKAALTYHRALSINEQKAFMEELKGNYYYNIIAFLLLTGMRFGEAAALTWRDIDTKQGLIHITKTLTANEHNQIITGDPKTAAGKRDIPLTESIKSLLKQQKSVLGNIYSISGETLLFPSVSGHYMRNQDINRNIRKAIESLNQKGYEIEHFTVHALRDTFATRFIEQGGNPQTLKSILGHESLQMTMDLYSHVLPNTKKAEMEKLIIAI